MRVSWVQLRLWKGATRWVALWLVLSVLTLLHAGALITAFYEVAIAKVCPKPSRSLYPSATMYPYQSEIQG